MNQHDSDKSLALAGSGLDTLKMAATALMVIDHVNAVVFDEYYVWMNSLGIGAFPLFAYAMACSLVHQVPIKKYAERLSVFAVISQPLFMLAFDDDTFNVLGTLLIGAAIGGWIVRKPTWRRHTLAMIALTAFFLEDTTDFDLSGIALPGLLACAMLGDRWSVSWTIIVLILLNVDFSDVGQFNNGTVVLNSPKPGTYLTAASTVVVPLVVYLGCRTISGDRFLPRFLLYVFYPAHLLLLAVYRISVGDIPSDVLSF